ncbi:alpha/beta hydrolase [Salinisphaera sp. USBA-960]|nr:alpha/beta hydrolase [Salifodinibacter halophilus]NNC25865.1 alpha/beta hydrolase [Salifodinibacter halophilus]
MAPHCVFAHGSESAPWGTKIQRLAEVAAPYDFEIASPDQQHLREATDRVADLKQNAPTGSPLVLVGSSMGGYVTAMACETLQPDALFLMAPAFYIDGFPGDPASCPEQTVVVHGWRDDVVPVASSIEFARARNARLHVLDDDHRLSESLDFLAQAFDAMLQRCLD